MWVGHTVRRGDRSRAVVPKVHGSEGVREGRGDDSPLLLDWEEYSRAFGVYFDRLMGGTGRE